MLKAFSPTGKPIVRTVDSLLGFTDATVEMDESGEIVITESDDGTQVSWDTCQSATEDGETIYEDSDHTIWRESHLVWKNDKGEAVEIGKSPPVEPAAPEIMIPDHRWKPNTSLNHPSDALRAEVNICSTSLHLEAIAVEVTESSCIPKACDPMFQDSVDAIFTVAGESCGNLSLTNIMGRTYILVATPYSA